MQRAKAGPGLAQDSASLSPDFVNDIAPLHVTETSVSPGLHFKSQVLSGHVSRQSGCRLANEAEPGSPLAPWGPCGPAGPGGPASPFAPWGPGDPAGPGGGRPFKASSERKHPDQRNNCEKYPHWSHPRLKHPHRYFEYLLPRDWINLPTLTQALDFFGSADEP